MLPCRWYSGVKMDGLVEESLYLLFDCGYSFPTVARSIILTIPILGTIGDRRGDRSPARCRNCVSRSLIGKRRWPHPSFDAYRELSLPFPLGLLRLTDSEIPSPRQLWSHP